MFPYVQFGLHVLYLGDPVTRLGIEVQTAGGRKGLFEVRLEVCDGRGPFITRWSLVRIQPPLLKKAPKRVFLPIKPDEFRIQTWDPGVMSPTRVSLGNERSGR
jgi:hypothetical protein